MTIPDRRLQAHLDAAQQLEQLHLAAIATIRRYALIVHDEIAHLEIRVDQLELMHESPSSHGRNHAHDRDIQEPG